MQLNIIPGLTEHNTSALTFTVVAGNDMQKDLNMEQAITIASQFVEANDGAVQQMRDNLSVGIDVNLLATGAEIGVYIFAGVKV